MYTPVNPSFTIKKWDLRGVKRYVFMMKCAQLSKGPENMNYVKMKPGEKQFYGHTTLGLTPAVVKESIFSKLGPFESKTKTKTSSKRK